MARKKRRSTSKRSSTPRPATTRKTTHRRIHSTTRATSMKDILIDGAVAVVGAVASSMIAKMIIKPGTPTATDPTGEIGAAKKRALVTLGLGVGATMLGKKSKLLASAGKGAIVYGGLNSVKSFMPNQTFLAGDDMQGEQLQFQGGYSPDNQLMGSTLEIAADEMADEMAAEMAADDMSGMGVEYYN